MKYGLTRFGDLLAEPLRNGVYKAKEYHGRGVNVINMKELFAHERIDDQSSDRVDLEPRELERFRVKSGDLLFARRSFVLAGAGKCSIVGNPIEDTTFESSMIRARPDPARALPQYLYYLFVSPIGRAAIAAIATQTAVSGITGRSLQEIMIPVPGLEIQRKITAVLAGYDDLIENNTSRIKLLGEMAQRIYREWFVDFRYPGHEDFPLVDSELGPIPQGWMTGTLDDLLDVNANTIRKVDPQETIQYVDISSVSRGVIDPPRRLSLSDAPGRARRRVADGDILWSTVRPNLRAHALLLSPGSDCVASTGFAVLSPRRASFAYIYALTTTDAFVEYLNGRATGSAYPAVTPPVFEKAPVVLPPSFVLQAFADAAEPMMRLAARHAGTNDNLRATRDLMLPRLISGEFDVSALDIAMAEDAA